MKNTSYLPRKINRAKSLAPLLGLGGILGLVGGCASEPQSHLAAPPALVSQPAPVAASMATGIVNPTITIVSQDAVMPSSRGTNTASQPASAIVVTEAPPALMTEVILPQTSPDQAWIAGYWSWSSDQYQWMAGHWEVRPSADARWVNARWEADHGAYRFHQGYWN